MSAGLGESLTSMLRPTAFGDAAPNTELGRAYLELQAAHPGDQATFENAGKLGKSADSAATVDPAIAERARDILQRVADGRVNLSQRTFGHVFAFSPPMVDVEVVRRLGALAATRPAGEGAMVAISAQTRVFQTLLMPQIQTLSTLCAALSGVVAAPFTFGGTAVQLMDAELKRALAVPGK